jgi:hypothetical protein
MNNSSHQWLRSVLAGLALAAANSFSQAQTMVNPNTFDTGIGSWTVWASTPGIVLMVDYTLDAANDPNSGSLRCEIPFTGAGIGQFMTFGTLGNRYAWDDSVVINAVGAYTNLVFDIRVDPTTAPTIHHDNYGALEVGLVMKVGTAWSTNRLNTYTIPLTATNWTSAVIPIDQTTVDLDKVTGVYFSMWPHGAYTNTMVFNVDNLWLQPMPTNAPPNPPPIMSLQKAIPGLNLIAAGNDQSDRQNIRTVRPEYSWVGKGSAPVSYAFTVKAFPGTNHPNFEVHNYLIPVPYDPASGPGTIDPGSAPDWGQTNCIFMELQNKADGSATYTFRWKTNSIPDGNGTYYSSPLAAIRDPNGPIGTWTLSFVNDTHVTMTSPSGSSTNFEFSADKLAGYVDATGAALPLYYYLGAKPQETINRGLSAVISRVSIQGAGTKIDDTFSNASGLDASIWELAANHASAVQVLAPNALYWVNWTLPDAGFALQTNAVVTGTNWNENGAATLQSTAGKSVLISSGDLPGLNQGFFRLIKRPFAKLQVLMPGETNAPGTATGKIGTPDPQTVSGGPFNVVVNAVDESWHIIKLAPNDLVTITSSDSTAALPADAALVSGTRTFSVAFGSEGNFTVTATDATDSTKQANTGTSTKVNP